MRGRKGKLRLTENLTASLCIVLVVSAPIVVAAEAYGPAYDADVTHFLMGLRSSDGDTVEEVMVQLSWAGISDPRIFQPLVDELRSGERLRNKTAQRYVRAIAMSGNPDMRSELEALAGDDAVPSAVRKAARKQLAQFSRYAAITQRMAAGLDAASSGAELWAIRHRNGLNAADPVLMRLAARDIYLHGYGQASLDVAAEFLREHATTVNEEDNFIDGLAFLCKALGLTRSQAYVDVLKEVANTGRVKKLVKYAERSVQYQQPAFEASNPTFN